MCLLSNRSIAPPLHIYLYQERIHRYLVLVLSVYITSRGVNTSTADNYFKLCEVVVVASKGMFNGQFN